TYDLQPEMSAPDVTDKLVAAIDAGRFDVVVVNYANADMVGHTGDLDAAIKAVETIDRCLGRLADAVTRAGGALLITRSRQYRDHARSRDRRAAYGAHDQSGADPARQSAARHRRAERWPALRCRADALAAPAPASAQGDDRTRPSRAQRACSGLSD